MNYLIVVAHPDDEALGAGATINRLIKDGHKVAVVTMANHAAARANISLSLYVLYSKEYVSAESVLKVNSYPGNGQI